MQIAGRECATCGGRLTNANEGRGCPACDKTFHKRCLTRRGLCPSCGGSFKLLQRAAEIKQQRADQDELTRGQALTIATIAAYMGPSGALVLLELPAENPALMGFSVARLLLMSALLVALYIGNLWARNVCIFFFLVGALAAFYAASGLSSGSAPQVVSALTSLGRGVIYVVCAAMLAFAPSVSAFLHDQRTRAQR